MNDILNEIDEDLRTQKLKAFWKENGVAIIGGVILALIMTAGLSFWRDWRDARNMKETAALMDVLYQENIEKLSSYAQEAKSDHKAFARFLEAGLLIQRKEKEKAIARYDEIAKDRKVDTIWRNLARLQSVTLQLDSGDPKKLQEDLTDMISAKKNPWKWSALELQALLFARTGDYARAAKNLEDIVSSSDAPDGLKSRAAALRDLYLGRKKEG